MNEEKERIENFLNELTSISQKYNLYMNQYYEEIQLLNEKHEEICIFYPKIDCYSVYNRDCSLKVYNYIESEE